MEYSVLNLASINGRLDIVNTLISANASLDIQDIYGYSALIWGILAI